MPIVTLKLPEAIEFTANVINAFTENRVTGIERIKLAALAPLIGYDAASSSLTIASREKQE